MFKSNKSYFFLSQSAAHGAHCSWGGVQQKGLVFIAQIPRFGDEKHHIIVGTFCTPFLFPPLPLDWERCNILSRPFVLSYSIWPLFHLAATYPDIVCHILNLIFSSRFLILVFAVMFLWPIGGCSQLFPIVFSGSHWFCWPYPFSQEILLKMLFSWCCIWQKTEPQFGIRFCS